MLPGVRRKIIAAGIFSARIMASAGPAPLTDDDVARIRAARIAFSACCVSARPIGTTVIEHQHRGARSIRGARRISPRGADQRLHRRRPYVIQPCRTSSVARASRRSCWPHRLRARPRPSPRIRHPPSFPLYRADPSAAPATHRGAHPWSGADVTLPENTIPSGSARRSASTTPSARINPVQHRPLLDVKFEKSRFIARHARRRNLPGFQSEILDGRRTEIPAASWRSSNSASSRPPARRLPMNGAPNRGPSSSENPSNAIANGNRSPPAIRPAPCRKPDPKSVECASIRTYPDATRLTIAAHHARYRHQPRANSPRIDPHVYAERPEPPRNFTVHLAHRRRQKRPPRAAGIFAVSRQLAATLDQRQSAPVRRRGDSLLTPYRRFDVSMRLVRGHKNFVRVRLPESRRSARR